MADNTSKAYINILTPKKDGAVYINDYGNSDPIHGDLNYHEDEVNLINFNAAGISLSGSGSFSTHVTNAKIIYREKGNSAWSETAIGCVYRDPTGNLGTSKNAFETRLPQDTTSVQGFYFSKVIPNFKLFTAYEWYVYAEYKIEYEDGNGGQGKNSDNSLWQSTGVTNETYIYKLSSHVRTCIFIPKTTKGSVRARVGSNSTEVYPAFAYSSDNGNTPTAKVDINGTVAKVPLVPTGNPLAGKVKMKTNSGVKHFAKRDPSIRDSGIGWTGYGEKYGAYYSRYGTNTPYSYTSGYRQDRVDTLYYYRYLYYNVVDNKTYDRRQEYKEYYNTDKSYAGNYRQYISSYYYVVDSYRTDSYKAYDKQYNKQYISGYSVTAYRTNYGVDGYYYYFGQYTTVDFDQYYYREYRYYEQTYNYPLYYQYTDNRYSRVDNAIQYYYRETRTATGSKSLNLTAKNIRYHSKVSSTTKQYWSNTVSSAGASYFLGHYLFPSGNYTGYYYEGSYNPSFYTASTESYTFTYNYTYNRTDTLPKYYSYYRLDSSRTAYAPNGRYAWNYVEKTGRQEVYATHVHYTEPRYDSAVKVTKYKVTGYSPSAYRTNYAYRTEYNGERTNYKQYIDRFHRVDVYRQDLVLQRSYYYTYYWTGAYYHTYPSAYRYDRSAYKTTYNQTPLYAYKYNTDYAISRYYKNYYKSYINMRE